MDDFFALRSFRGSCRDVWLPRARGGCGQGSELGLGLLGGAEECSSMLVSDWLSVDARRDTGGDAMRCGATPAGIGDQCAGRRPPRCLPSCVVWGGRGEGGTAAHDIRNPTSENPLHARSPHPGCVLYGLGCVSTQRHSTDTNKQCTHARHTCQMPDHTDARAHCTARSPRGVEVEDGAQPLLTARAHRPFFVGAHQGVH